MKKSLISIAVVAVVLVAGFIWVKNTYNSLVSSSEEVSAAWAQVENVYQRRADLIPNLVATVKGYAEHESETLAAVVEARSKATSVTISPEELNEESIAAFQAAQNNLSGALGRLIAIAENYPELKASQNFSELQAQLEGTENRISVERQKFNDTALAYNKQVKMFPSNIVASIFGLEQKGYFKAAEGAQNAPVVEF
ncbi:MAG: LemA family protein [Candidatus Cryptobacteroides sp.]|nr:LemA family protein [Bacteroidales bacterium]MDD6052673.1 LemA family protein [Bacteroidales bacterium]